MEPSIKFKLPLNKCLIITLKPKFHNKKVSAFQIPYKMYIQQVGNKSASCS